MAERDALCAHRVPLGVDADWELWRCIALRGAGFPARNVLRLAATEASRAADAILAAEQAVHTARDAALDALRTAIDHAPEEQRGPYRKAWKQLLKRQVPAPLGPAVDPHTASLRLALERVESAHRSFRQRFEASLERQSGILRDISADPRFREAVVWQNHGALRTGLDPLLRHRDDDGDRSRYKRVEELVAGYFQRYCVKNDTIGFFGPIAWAHLAPDEESTRVEPGPSFLRARGVFFEQWGIDALAATLSADPRMEPWMCPRRLPHVRVDGCEVRSAMGPAHVLPPEHAALLRSCDGVTTARQLAMVFVRDGRDVFPDDSAVYDTVRALKAKGFVTWEFEVPLKWRPESELAALLARIEDEPLRRAALDVLAQLERARAAVEGARGNAEQLDEAMESLQATFTAMTGKAPTRNAGGTYGARTLVFEDTQRDLDMTVGRDVLENLAPALHLILQSARWFTFEIARRYREELTSVFQKAANGAPTVRFTDLWFRAQRLFRGSAGHLQAVHADMRQRWSRIVGADADGSVRRIDRRSQDLRAAVHDAFAAPGPGWRDARQHSPDVMIAASDVEALRRGEYYFVLGEVHPSVCTIDNAFWVAQHPDPREIRQAIEGDFPEARVLSVLSKAWPRTTVRTSRGCTNPSDYFLALAADPAGERPERVLLMADLVVVERDGGRLEVQAEDGRVSLDIIDFLGDMLSGVVYGSGFRLLDAQVPHSPRLTIDRFVVCRESWMFAAPDLPFGSEKTEADQFLSIRRWAIGTGLPRHVFVRSPLEVKPFFVDFESPVLTGVLARAVRRAKAHEPGPVRISVEEMLPGIEETWLSDATGERYTSELRFIAVDVSPPAAV